MSRGWIAAAGGALALAMAGCSAASGQVDEQYRAAMEALYQGDVLAFYDRLVPESYERDLNAALDKAKSLFDEEDYEAAKQLVDSTAQRVASQLQNLPEPPPQARLLAEALEDLPGALGVETYQQFQQATVGTMLASLQASRLGDALRHPDSPVEWSRQTVELIEQGETRAKLRVTSQDPDSPPDVKTVELIKVGEKWVPADVARQWDERMRQINARLDAWKAEKEANPLFVRQRLRRLREQVDMAAALISSLLRQMPEPR